MKLIDQLRAIIAAERNIEREIDQRLALRKKHRIRAREIHGRKA